MADEENPLGEDGSTYAAIASDDHEGRQSHEEHGGYGGHEEETEITEALAAVSVTPTPAPAATSTARSSAHLRAPNPADTFPSLFDIAVSDPVKRGDGMNAYMAYTIVTKTTASDYDNPSMNVSRRFTNFIWLYNQLTTKYPGYIVPPIPEKQAIGRFDSEFLEQRRIGLETCLRRIASHSALSKSSDFKLFLEADDLEGEIKKREPKKSLFSSLTSSMTDAVQNATSSFSKIPETDEWFENKRAQLEVLESHLKALLKVVQTFARQRKELAGATGDFGGSVSSLGASENSKSLGACLSHLGEVEKKIEEILNSQVTSDEQDVEFVVDEYVRIVGSIKLALEARVKAYTAWKAAESSLAKKKEQLKQAKNRPTDADIEEAEKAVEKAKQSFEEISETLKKELTRFDLEKIEDFKQGLTKFVVSMVENQKKVVAIWESFLPEVQAL